MTLLDPCRANGWRNNRKLHAAATLLLSALLCLLWGLTYPAVKAALRDGTPMANASAARITGLLPTLALGFAFGGRFPTTWRFHRTALLLGLGNVAGLSAFLNLGSVHVSSGEASLIVYTQPLLTAIGARIWLGERGSSWRTAGLLTGFVGLAVVLADRIHPGAHPAWHAYVELVGAAISWTAGTLIFKRVPQGMSLIWLAALQNLYGAVPIFLLLPFVEQPHLHLTHRLVFLLLFQGAVIGPVGWLIWLRLLERGEASVVSGNVFFVPLIAVLSGVVLLGERLHPAVIAGGVLIAVGITLVNRSVTPLQHSTASAAGVSPAQQEAVAPVQDAV